MTDGIESLKLFVPSAILVSEEHRFMELGIGPLKEFDDKSNNCNEESDPPKKLMWPFNLFLFICKATNEESELNPAGIVPEIEFW